MCLLENAYIYLISGSIISALNKNESKHASIHTLIVYTYMQLIVVCVSFINNESLLLTNMKSSRIHSSFIKNNTVVKAIGIQLDLFYR